MTRKRFIKKLMADGFSRDHASRIAKRLKDESYADYYAALLPCRISMRSSMTMKQVIKAVVKLAESFRLASGSAHVLSAALQALGKAAQGCGDYEGGTHE